MVNKLSDDEILNLYVGMFGDYPPLIMTISPKNKIYIDLMRKALIGEKEVTQEDVYKAVDKIPYDLVVDDDDLSARAYAEKYSIKD